MAETPTWAEVIRRAVDARLLDVHVALPGRVQSYDKDAQTVDVKPEIKRVIRTRLGAPVEEELPVIPSVPVEFPGANGFYITFPITAGDTGLITFCESDLDRWLEVGNDVNPGDQRRHGLSGAVFKPGLKPSADALGMADDTNMALGKDGGFVVHITPADIELPAGSTEKLARADRITTELTALKAAISGAIPLANDGGAQLQTQILSALNAPPVFPQDTGSDKVKGT